MLYIKKVVFTAMAWVMLVHAAPLLAADRPDMGPRHLPSMQRVPTDVTQPQVPPPRETTAYASSWKQLEKPARVDISAGYRVDNLNWNIAADNSGTLTPNVLSELKWKNLRSYQIHGNGEVIVPEGALKGLYMNASGYHGWITSGKNQDSDYEFNNRSGEFSRSNNDANGGATVGASGALGYAFEWNHIQPVQVLRLIGMAGYAYDKQKLHITNGNQTVSNCAFGGFICGAPLGPFSGLDSRYDARWKGPFLGLDMGARFAQRHYVRLKGQYHWANYHGEANWNLRGDFLHPRSFEHEADGTGYLLGLMYAFSLTDGLDLTLEGEYENFSTDAGSDSTYSVFGTGTTRLNEVNWNAKTVRAGVDYKF